MDSVYNIVHTCAIAPLHILELLVVKQYENRIMKGYEKLDSGWYLAKFDSESEPQIIYITARSEMGVSFPIKVVYPTMSVNIMAANWR